MVYLCSDHIGLQTKYNVTMCMNSIYMIAASSASMHDDDIYNVPYDEMMRDSAFKEQKDTINHPSQSHSNSTTELTLQKFL